MYATTQHTSTLLRAFWLRPTFTTNTFSQNIPDKGEGMCIPIENRYVYIYNNNNVLYFFLLLALAIAFASLLVLANRLKIFY